MRPVLSGLARRFAICPPAAVLLRPRGRGGQVKSNKRTFTRPSWMALLDPEETFRGG